MVSKKLFTLAACVSSALAATTPYVTTKSHTTGPPPYSTTPPVSTQTMWGLCGGLAFSFAGSVVCTSTASCAHFNSFYWQCIPPATTTTVTTTSKKPVYPTSTLVSLTLPPASTTTTAKSTTRPPTSTTTTKTYTTSTTTTTSVTGGPTGGVPLYGQCGGQGFTGATVCVSGATCVRMNEFFSQCFANDAIPSSTSTKATTTKSVLNPEQTENAQCGGSGWTGATTCIEGLVCYRWDEGLSTCRPPK